MWGTTLAMLVAGFAAARSLSAPVKVPETLREREDETLALVAHARGDQIYECRQKTGDDYAFDWAFVAPDAELFDEEGRKIGRHYAGPQWEAADGSRIAGKVVRSVNAPVADAAIPWLLLETASVGREGAFSAITSVQRVATVGGVAPPHGCPYAGFRVEIPYTADYYLFTKK
jgi:hypothetical protein